MSFFGTRWLSGSALTLFGLFRGITRSYGYHKMPVIVEGLKAADGPRASPGRLVVPVIVVTAVDCMSSAWAYYSQAYRFGAQICGKHWGIGSFDKLRSLFIVTRGAESYEPTFPT